MSSRVSDFLRQNGLEGYVFVMQDQGFDDLEDLVGLCQDDETLATLVPAMGHRSKLKRLLKASTDGGGGGSSSASVPPATPPLAATIATAAPASQAAPIAAFNQPLPSFPPNNGSTPVKVVKPAEGGGGGGGINVASFFSQRLQQQHSAMPFHDPSIVAVPSLPPSAAPPLFAEQVERKFAGGSQQPANNPLTSLLRSTFSSGVGGAPVVVTSNLESFHTQQGVSVTVPPSLPKVTEASVWLTKHNLSMYIPEVHSNNIASLLDLSALAANPLVLAAIFPFPPHRSKFHQLILAEPAANPAHPLVWMQDVKPPVEDDLHSNHNTSNTTNNNRLDGDSISHTSEEPGISILSQLATQIEAKYVRQTGGTPTPLTKSDATPTSMISAPRSWVDVVSATPATATGPDDDDEDEVVNSGNFRHNVFVEDEDSGDDQRLPSAYSGGGRKGRLPPASFSQPPLQYQAAPILLTSSANPQFVTIAGKRIDVILLENNAALRTAMKSGSGGIICKRPSCTSFSDCTQLHFRTVSTRYEGKRVAIKCCYIDGVTDGLAQALNHSQHVGLCIDFPQCALHERCNKLHVTAPLLPGHTHPMGKLSLTFPLLHLLEQRPVDKKPDPNLRICQSFRFSQLCLFGTRCNNFHVLPDAGLAKAFFAECRSSLFEKHVHSTKHLNHESYDIGAMFARTGRIGMELGEAMDYLLYTQCCVCRNMLFPMFRKVSRRQGVNLLWTIAGRLQSGDADRVLATMMKTTNSALALTQDKMIEYTSPLHDIVVTVQDAIAARLRDLSKFGGAVRPGDTFAHIFWDFDNVLIPDRSDLLLFYSCLTAFLCREKFASSRCCITAKAFGTQHSLDHDAVDALRDMQVETVLCSSKKQEETDRQLERSTRALHHSNQNASAVILSSDKDFMIIAKELARSGIPVITVHSAQKDSAHEAVLHHGSVQAVSVMDLYLSTLKASSIQRPVNPWVAHRNSSDSNSNSNGIGNNGQFDAHQRHHIAADRGGGGSRHRGDDSDEDDDDEGLVVHTRVEVPPGLRRAKSPVDPPMLTAPPPVFGLATLVAAPKPPASHAVWYRLLIEAYLLRLLDRLRLGEACGVFSAHATDADALDHAEIFFDMAQLVPNFLPPGFSTSEALRLCRPRLMDTHRTSWMAVEYMSSFAWADNFQHVFILIRHIGNIVDGPLESMIDGSQLARVRLIV